MTRLFILLWLVFPVSAYAQNVSDPMRGLIWGLPMEAIAGFEKGTFVSEENGSLFYMDNITVNGKQAYPALIEYHFTRNKLDRIRYDFTVNSVHPEDTLDDMMNLQNWLDDIFAQSSKPDFYFRNTRERDDPAIWGWAIFRGTASVTIDWQTPKTQARISLKGSDYTPDMTLRLTPASIARNP